LFYHNWLAIARGGQKYDLELKIEALALGLLTVRVSAAAGNQMPQANHWRRNSERNHHHVELGFNVFDCRAHRGGVRFYGHRGRRGLDRTGFVRGVLGTFPGQCIDGRRAATAGRLIKGTCFAELAERKSRPALTRLWVTALRP
jgi:hypothetical protein